MKKILSIILALLFILPTTTFAEVNWNEMTDEEIKSELEKGTKELNSHNDTTISIDDSSCVLLDSDGITVTINGDIKLDKNAFNTCDLTIPVLVTNTNKGYAEIYPTVYINGLGDDDADGMFILKGETEKQCDIRIFEVNKDYNLTSLNDVETIEFHFMTGIENDDGKTQLVQSDIIKTIAFK